MRERRISRRCVSQAARPRRCRAGAGPRSRGFERLGERRAASSTGFCASSTAASTVMDRLGGLWIPRMPRTGVDPVMAPAGGAAWRDDAPVPRRRRRARQSSARPRRHRTRRWLDRSSWAESGKDVVVQRPATRRACQPPGIGTNAADALGGAAEGGVGRFAESRILVEQEVEERRIGVGRGFNREAQGLDPFARSRPRGAVLSPLPGSSAHRADARAAP